MSNVIDFSKAATAKAAEPDGVQRIAVPDQRVPILACHCASTNFEMLLDGHIRCARCGCVDMSWVKPT